MSDALFILNQLTHADDDWLAKAGRRERFPTGTVLVREGEAIDALMLILAGVVSINVDGIGEVARVANGEMVGEMSLLDQSLPFASVIVVEPVDVLSIDHSKLEAKIESDPGFATRLYRAMAMLLSFRLRAAVQRPKDKRK